MFKRFCLLPILLISILFLISIPQISHPQQIDLENVKILIENGADITDDALSAASHFKYNDILEYMNSSLISPVNNSSSYPFMN